MEKVGIYYYFLPTYTQAKKIIWEGIDKDGVSFHDHVPKEIVAKRNDSELKYELINGSIIRLIGTDNYDAIRGTNPIGCVFSEYAFQDPRVWDVIRPILDENGGWATFNTTPNGENHAYDLYERVKEDPMWFCEVLTIEDTKAISLDVISQARREGVDEDTIAREYYCSFSASVLGAYYGQQMKEARDQGRITRVSHQPTSLVYTAWDLGRDDSTTVWLFQRVGKEFLFINCFEGNGEEMSYYAKKLLELQKTFNYTFGGHYLPHDANSKTISTKFSPRETLINFGIPPADIHVVDRTKDLLLDIQTCRAMLPQCWFDEILCKDGLAALRSYSKKYDEVRKVFSNTPDHNWASHYADAFRSFAVGWRDPLPKKKIEHRPVWNPLTGEYL